MPVRATWSQIATTEDDVSECVLPSDDYFRGAIEVIERSLTDDDCQGHL